MSFFRKLHKFSHIPTTKSDYRSPFFNGAAVPNVPQYRDGYKDNKN
jgi:hypothetical protein